jgi:hypothetical protein
MVVSQWTYTLTPLFAHSQEDESDGELDGWWWALMGPFLARAEVRRANL